MQYQRVTLPTALTIDSALRFARELKLIKPSRPVVIDFFPLGHASPFAMVMCAKLIRGLVDQMNPRQVVFAGYKNKSYLAHMGFFRACGLPFGNNVGDARGSTRYIPITEIDCKELYILAARDKLPLGELVEERAQQIAAVLTQQVDGDLHDALSFSIREMLRNALEHSQTTTLAFCAQFWPTQDRVEVAIVDCGRGIKASLERNPYLKCTDDRIALNYALMPGVSGTAFKGSKRNRKDVWQNSGYGLYMTSRICRLGGHFFIGSREAALSLDEKGKEYKTFSFPGTCVGLIIKPTRTANLSSMLKQFSIEGKEIAESIDGVILQPSKASQMLTVDFQKQ